MTHLVIMAAGTGGHIIPGLAVAREALLRGWSVSWLGTAQGMENQFVPRAGITLDTIGFSGLRGKGLLGWITGGLRLQQAFWQCHRILRRRAADVVLGMGGYVCFPGGLMASALNRPLMLVNADAALLLSNKWLLPLAERIAFGFDGEAARATRNAVVTGNPVRTEIEAIAAPERRLPQRKGALRVLVVGGSLGARVLNDTLPQALARMSPEARPMVTHQTGNAHHAAVQSAYEAAGVEAEVVPFIDDMARALTLTDLMICRAGAGTVSELCAAGVASLLVPLIVSTTSHQRDNAEWLAGQGAAVHLPQADLTPARLAAELEGLTRERLLDMARKARSLARPRAAARVVDELAALAAARVRKGAA